MATSFLEAQVIQAVDEVTTACRAAKVNTKEELEAALTEGLDELLPTQFPVVERFLVDTETGDFYYTVGWRKRDELSAE